MVYTWSERKNEEIYSNGTFESIEECISEAKECKVPIGTTIYVGECKEATISGVDLSTVLEQVEENMYEQVGEVSESWNISSIRGREEIYKTFEKRLRQLACDYIDEIGEKPSFYHVTNVKPVLVN